MSLGPGQKLLHYRIIDKIGEGGMGVVWHAVDTALEREVAIKVLPESLAGDPDRLLRFEREAKLLASLNHPNIAPVFGLQDAEGIRFLAMGLVPGEDLSARLERGPMPVREALEVARQVADALDAAHEQGVVHRDLKPANVKITPDGGIRVLDFGLAKALDDAGSAARRDPAKTPTLTSAGTLAGTLLGTVTYMPPEQARGRTVDRRADVWAFGCVLYEMLTGRQAFPGETISDTLAGILKGEPDWSALPRDLPGRVRTLLERCLEKDPRRRIQAMGDARWEIEEALRHPQPAVSSIAQAVPRPRFGAREVALLGGAVAVSILATAFVMSRLVPSSHSAPTRKFEIPLETPIGQIAERTLAISPDGSKVVYESGDRLWVREWREFAPREIPGTQGAKYAFWSPDGASIAYASGDKLWRLSLPIGQPISVCSLPGPFGGGAWSPSGRIVFVTVRGAMLEVSARGGDATPVLVPDGIREIDFHHPSFLPEGEGLVFAVHRREGVDTIEALVRGSRKVLLRVEGQARAGPQVLNLPSYSPTGHLVFERDQGNPGVWAVRFSPSKLEISGTPFLVAADGVSPTVSRDGTLVFALRPSTGPGELAWVSRRGELEQTFGPPRPGLSDPALSPDARRAAAVVDENDNQDIWIYDLESGNSSRLTFSSDDDNNPEWFPEGDRLAYSCGSEQGTGICVKAADGTGEAIRLLQDAGSPAVSPDGRLLVYQPRGEARRGLMIVEVPRAAEPTHFLNVTYDVGEPAVSPNGRFVAYHSMEGGRGALYVSALPPGDGKWLVGEASGWTSRWSRDGRELFFASDPETIDVASVDAGSGFRSGAPRLLFSTEGFGGRPGAGFDVAPDGRFLMARASGKDRRRASFFVVQNWAAEFE